MAYTPDNPYIPGDPYSYDLKWIVAEVKHAIELYEPLSDDFSELYNYVHDYFANLDITAEVRAILNEMDADGTLEAIIQPILDEYTQSISNDIAVLEARMDTFASLPAGSTAGNAELLDIRVASDGDTYDSAGNAVRGQVDYLKDNQVDFQKILISSASDFTLVNTTINSSGAITGSANYKAAKFEVKKNDVISFRLHSSSTSRSIAFYDYAGNMLWVDSTGSRTTSYKTYEAPDDGFVYLACHNDYLSAAYAIRISSTVLSRNSDTEDAVAAACDYHRTSESVKNFSLLIAGDIHSSVIQMDNIVDYLNANVTIDAGIMLGDIASSNFTHPITYYTNAIARSRKPFLTVIGNHDAGNSNDPATSFTDPNDLYNKFIAPNIQYAQVTEGTEWISGDTYYYKDFTDYNIRLIVLNQHDYPSDMTGTELTYTRADSYYSQDQLDWFVNTLDSTPTNYSIIIALHTTPDSMVKDFDSTFTSPARGTGNLYDHSCMTGYPIVHIVNAWINGTAINQTYDYRRSYNGTLTGTTATVNTDFSGRGPGKFICYIGGHWHGSYVSHSSSFPDQLEYSVDCASISTGATEDSDTPRERGTRSEDCFCVLSVDTANEKINLVRVGARMTNYMLDRFVTQLDY